MVRLLKCLAMGVLVLLVASPARLWAWGEEGHRLVARIAELQLSKQARDGIRDLLGDRSISDNRIPVWADVIKSSSYFQKKYPRNQTWHYIDIDVKENLDTLDLAKYCAGGNCALERIPEYVGVLKNPKAGDADRREALFFVIHLVGDIHQPLHCASRENDRGGNLVRVTLPGEEESHGHVSNLHRVWDTDLVREVLQGVEILDAAGRWNAKITPEQRKTWQAGTIKDWVLESHRIARQAYEPIPVPGANHKPFLLKSAYIKDNAAVVEQQIQRGGVRLAYILNKAFE